MFGFHHYDITIGPPIPAVLSWPMRKYEGYITVTLINRYHNSKGQCVLCLRFMTIKNDRLNNHIPTTENAAWMELSADKGQPIECQCIFYS